MKRVMICSIIVLLFSHCNFGVWNTSGVFPTYRPKHPKFKILKQPFLGNNLIDTNHLYIGISKIIYEGDELVGLYGFYGDGRVLLTGGKKNDIINIVAYTSTFENARWVGYYTTQGDIIKFEYFVPGDGGQYETREGVIKKDTIIIIETFNLLFKKEIRSDTLIKSTYPLK